MLLKTAKSEDISFRSSGYWTFLRQNQTKHSALVDSKDMAWSAWHISAWRWHENSEPLVGVCYSLPLPSPLVLGTLSNIACLLVTCPIFICYISSILTCLLIHRSHSKSLPFFGCQPWYPWVSLGARFHSHLGAILQHRSMHLRQRRRGDGLLLDALQIIAGVQWRSRPGTERHGLLESLLGLIQWMEESESPPIKHPIIICRVSTIQGGAGVLPSTVGLKGTKISQLFRGSIVMGAPQLLDHPIIP